MAAKKGGVTIPNWFTFPISPFGGLGVGRGIAGLFDTGHFALQEPCSVHTRDFGKDTDIAR